MAWTEKQRGGNFTGRYRDPTGRVRSAGTSPDRKMALLAAQTQEARVYGGKWRDPKSGDVPFSEYFRYWIAVRVLEVNGRSYYLSNFNAKRHGLGVTFGYIPLTKITRPLIQTWVARMIEDGLKPRTIKGRVATLQAVLGARSGPSALNDGLLEVNPSDRITVPHQPVRRVSIYTPEQVDALVEHLDPWWRMQILFDSETGLRFGELIALRVSDVNLERLLVTVERTIVETAKRNTGNGTTFMTKEYPKDREPRTVGLTVETASMLQAHIDARQLNPDDRLFAMPVLQVERTGHRTLLPSVERTDVWPGGVPIGRSYFRKVWQRATATAGLPPLRVHDLRSSFISWLLDDPRLAPQHVMDIVGHSRWDTTRRYQRSMGRAQQLGASAIADLRQRTREGQLGQYDESPVEHADRKFDESVLLPIQR